MNKREFEQEVRSLPFGKRLPHSLYFLREFADQLSVELYQIVRIATELHSIGAEYNVLKLNSESFSISFLSYPEFWDSPHPALASAVLVDLTSGRVKRQEFAERSNPPILHRKETFLPESHASRPLFAALTRQEEEAGLYSDTTTIGFRQNWQRLLDASGLAYRGHELLKVGDGTLTAAPSQTPGTLVARHKTAISRSDLSRPVKVALEGGLIHSGRSFFDYGCGQGVDVDVLASMGYESIGWDPVHRPGEAKIPSDVVNLGYVLNVIEDPAERIATLAEAWNLTRSALIVTGLTKGMIFSDNSTEFGDGVLTRRNTFQKFFDHTELQILIEEALEASVVPLGLGMFVVFRELATREDFLERKSRRTINWEEVASRLRSLPRVRSKRDPYFEHADLMDDFWSALIGLGRVPKAHEYARLGEVRAVCGSLRSAQQVLLERYGEDALLEARARRKEDLLVYLALAQFASRRTPFSQLSPGLQGSIAAFFGTYREATRRATELLYAAGNVDTVEGAARNLEFGSFEPEEGHFTCHRSLLDDLPAVLRVYVGCGSQLFGDVREADLIKIHVRSQKLTCMFYDQFERRRFPTQLLRVKIDFGRLEIREFAAPAEPNRQVLLFKERYLSKNHKGYRSMEATSKGLRKLGLNETNIGHGIEQHQLEKLLGPVNGPN